MEPILYFIIPCYNEEKVLPVTFPGFLDKLMNLIGTGRIHTYSRILFVDDGSSDTTWKLIQSYAKKDDHVVGIQQSRNRGHQNALLAGLLEAEKFADITITMDCDGQDDLEAVDRMLDEYEKGAEIVYGIRKDRDTDTLGKKLTSKLFYKLMGWLGAETLYQHGDFRLVSARALHAFADYKEVNLFLRGIFPLVGFRSTSIYYERKQRAAGESHYTISKMFSLAIDGITGFTVKPIRIITGIGFIISILGLIAIGWAIVQYFLGHTVDGWASMMCVVAFLGGIQVFSIGVIGEYIGKVYLETKHRPRYIISETAGENNLRKKKQTTENFTKI